MENALQSNIDWRGTLKARPGKIETEVIAEDGRTIAIPTGWECLPPGDAFLTRRVKSAGVCIQVSEKRGRKVFSRGVWAPADIIRIARNQVEDARQEPSYERKLTAGRERRAELENLYGEEFRRAVLTFLRFHSRHIDLAENLAAVITAHATPVGSGTVARTERIPIERRAEAAVIAWLRHATTGYDTMTIPRVKGMRREVRRMLAERSRLLLARYRNGEEIPAARCPIAEALEKNTEGKEGIPNSEFRSPN